MRVNIVPKGHKRCTDCKQILQYDDFYSTYNIKNNCFTVCKHCLKDSIIKEMKDIDTTEKVKEEVKKCKTCGEIKPKSEFRKYGRSCKKCINLQQSIRRKAERLKTSQARKEEKEKAKAKEREIIRKTLVEKTCCLCKQLLPVSAFNRNNKNKDGLESGCRECRKERERINKLRRLRERGY